MIQDKSLEETIFVADDDSVSSPSGALTIRTGLKAGFNMSVEEFMKIAERQRQAIIAAGGDPDGFP